MDDIISKVFAAIPSTVYVIGFKFNIEDLSDDDVESALIDLYNYAQSVTNESIIVSSSGLHEEGKSEKPHVHYNVVAKAVNATFRSNRSKHTASYEAKNNITLPIMSVKQKNVNYDIDHEYKDNPNAKFEFLGYPYKENKKIGTYTNYFSMLSLTEQTRFEEFLITYATDRYEAKIRKDLSNEASKERKQNAYLELLDLAEESHKITKFKSLYELQQWFDVTYVSKLERGKVTNMRNFSENVKNVAIALGIEKYYNIYK